MELRDLRAFAAVLELGGMTRASKRLHVVQSAVSQAVKRLEQQYDLQLLERRPDGIRPTAAGEALGRHAQRILDDVSRLDADMASHRGRATGVVNVGVMSTMTPILAARLVRAVDEQLPAVTLRLREGVSGELLELLRRGRLDLVVVLAPIDTGGLPIVETGCFSLVVVVAPGHRLNGTDQVAFVELAEEAWISFAPTNPARRWLDANCRRAGFRPVVAAEIDTLAQLKAFVQAGHGIALLPPEVAALELETGVLRAVRIAGCDAETRHGFAFDPDQPLSAASRQVRTVLEAELRALRRAVV